MAKQIEVTLSLIRICRKDDISRKTRSTLFPKDGNNVEATFDFVESIVRLVAFDNVASTLFLVWTGLKTADEHHALNGSG